jgi:two-component system, chemotaxis family, chemotaxis protein CheY
MLRVLIVDDSEGIRAKLRAFLIESGHRVIGEAWDGKEAVQLYPKLKPDLVTMDVVMPEMDGLTALREIRASDPKARIIMLSSAASQTNLEMAKKYGAICFLIKPLQREELTRVLQEIEKALKEEKAA